MTSFGVAALCTGISVVAVALIVGMVFLFSAWFGPVLGGVLAIAVVIVGIFVTIWLADRSLRPAQSRHD